MEAMLCGGVLGLIAGAVAALLWLPKSIVRLRHEATQAMENAQRDLRARAEAAVTDPVNASIAEGKAAARRRRRELGLDDAP
jgi:gas vesicle protein